MVATMLSAMFWAVVWFVVMPIGVLAFAIPASVWIVGRQSRGGLWAFAGWIVASQAGWVPTFAGPFGLPGFVFWTLTGVFGVWFAVGLAVMVRAAVAQACFSHRLMRDYGMPPSEIV